MLIFLVSASSATSFVMSRIARLTIEHGHVWLALAQKRVQSLNHVLGALVGIDHVGERVANLVEVGRGS